jgi:hypothetical protein
MITWKIRARSIGSFARGWTVYARGRTVHAPMAGQSAPPGQTVRDRLGAIFKHQNASKVQSQN